MKKLLLAAFFALSLCAQSQVTPPGYAMSENEISQISTMDLPSFNQADLIREAEEKISQRVENSVKRMREATKKANRSEALYELAKLLAEQKYSKILDHTVEIRKIAGTMPYGIQQYENEPLEQ